MATQYPFADLKAKYNEFELFKKKLPQVAVAMPEFFRVLEISFKSIEQKNAFNQPQGIYQSTGFDTAVKMLLIAMINDQIIGINSDPVEFIHAMRTLTLKWYSFGNELNACVYFGHYFYSLHSQSLHLIKDQLNNIRFLIDETNQLSKDLATLELIKPPSSNAWYINDDVIGDKLLPIVVSKRDVTKVDLPIPGYQFSFNASKIYDLRTPVFLHAHCVERPQVNNGKAIVSCPSCSQKCRVPVFHTVEVKCPNCKQVWQQRI